MKSNRMKFDSKGEEVSADGFMYGLVIIGTAAGKLKYTLLDKQDVALLQQHLLEPYVDIDRNGMGTRVFAYAYNMKRGKISGRYVQDILWEKYYGGIAPGFRVVHKNGITVDNRLENLMLCPKDYNHYQNVCQKNPEDSLYWSAVVEMPPETELLYENLFSAREEQLLRKEDRCFECHYPPCSKIEERPMQFSICSLCEFTRYCSLSCQSRDWPWHKPLCTLRPRPKVFENLPDR